MSLGEAVAAVPMTWERLVEQITDLDPQRQATCYYGSGDPTHQPARFRFHDARGCVVVCDPCRQWRLARGVHAGHGETCPDAGFFGKPADH